MEHCEACGQPTPDHVCRCKVEAIEAACLDFLPDDAPVLELSEAA